MVTAGVTYFGGLEEKRVTHRKAAGAAHKGSDQATLYGRRAGRGVRGQQAHNAKGPRGTFGNGRATALHAGSWGRLLPAAGRQEALAFVERGRGARADRLLRSPTQVPGAPLLYSRPFCGDQAASRSAQRGRGGSRQAQEARLCGRSGARLRGPALGRAAFGGTRRGAFEGSLRLDGVGSHGAGDLPVRLVRLSGVLVLCLLRPKEGDERPDAGRPLSFGREGRGLRAAAEALHRRLAEHRAGSAR